MTAGARSPKNEKNAARTVEGTSVPTGYQQIVAATLASAQALTIPAGGAEFALIQAELDAVRWRDDGTNPTASIGMLIPAGQTISYTGDLTTFKAIRVGATSILNVSYYK